MHSFTRFAITSLFASTLLIPATALAGEKDTPPPAEDPMAGLKGFELMLRPSIGGAPSDSPVRYQPDPGIPAQAGVPSLLTGASPWGPGFVGQAMVGYRFLPFLSAGLRGGIRTASGSNLNDGSTSPSRSGWDAGFYARGYPLATFEGISKYVDPWISVGVEYMKDKQSFQTQLPTTTGGSVQGDIAIEHHAVAIPIGIGVDYRVAKFLSLGPSFEYAFASAVAGCLRTTALGNESSHCSNSSPDDKIIKANSYGVWTAGLDAKVTF